MTFFFPWLLYGGSVLAVALAGMYFFKRRHRERKVSALFLWVSPEQLAGEGRKFSSPETNLVFLLELLILACLLCAAAAPLLKLSRPVTELVFILDNSASMSVAGVREKALENIRHILRENEPYKAIFLQTGRHPKMLGNNLLTEKECQTILDKWNPSLPFHTFKNAFSFGTQLAAGNGTIHFITDHAPRQTQDAERPETLAWHAVGTPLFNTGILSGRRRRNEGGTREEVLLRLVNNTLERRTLELDFFRGVDANGEILFRRSFSLDAGESRMLFEEIPQTFDEPLFIRLTHANDPFPRDDTFLLFSEARPPVRVALDFKTDSRLRPLAERTLRALKGSATESSFQNADLIWSDNSGDSINPDAWKLLFQTGSLEKSQIIYNNYIPDKNDPLFSGMELQGVRWAVPENTPSETPQSPALLSGGPQNLVLFAEGALPGFRRSLLMNYVPERSSLHRTPAWPILFHNLVRERQNAMDGLPARNLVWGEILAVSDSRARELLVTEPDGTERRIPFFNGKAEFLPEQTGVYHLAAEDGRKLGMVSVSGGSAEESDLRTAQTMKDLPGKGLFGDKPVQQDLWSDDSRIFLLAAFLLLLLRVFLLKRKELKHA